MPPAAIIANLHLKLTYWGCFICVRQFCITFISFWCSYTSKYRGYINPYKFKREKNYYLISRKAEKFNMHGELLGVGEGIFCWASPIGLKNLPQFLVTFVDMFRNDVTFKSKSVKNVKNVCHFFKRVQIWNQNNNKLSPFTQGYWNFATATRSWENIICCPIFSYTESCHDIVLYLKPWQEI